MSSDRRRQRLLDILENVGRIRTFVDGIDRERFLADTLIQDAVERCLERIAEAARKIGDAYDTSYPDAGLKALRQFSSVLRHDYDAIHPDLIWGTVARRLDALQRMAEDALRCLAPDDRQG